METNPNPAMNTEVTIKTPGTPGGEQVKLVQPRPTDCPSKALEGLERVCVSIGRQLLTPFNASTEEGDPPHNYRIHREYTRNICNVYH